MSWFIKIELKQFFATIRAPRSFRVCYIISGSVFEVDIVAEQKQSIIGNDFFVL